MCRYISARKKLIHAMSLDRIKRLIAQWLSDVPFLPRATI
jgi:hypothetical protein